MNKMESYVIMRCEGGQWTLDSPSVFTKRDDADSAASRMKDAVVVPGDWHHLGAVVGSAMLPIERIAAAFYPGGALDDENADTADIMSNVDGILQEHEYDGAVFRHAMETVLPYAARGRFAIVVEEFPRIAVEFQAERIFVDNFALTHHISAEKLLETVTELPDGASVDEVWSAIRASCWVDKDAEESADQDEESAS